MTQENVTKFYEAVVQDPNLQQQIFTAPDHASLINTAMQLGAENGYSFTEQEFEDWLTTRVEQSTSDELSDTELEMVAGGKDVGEAVGDAFISASLEVLSGGTVGNIIRGARTIATVAKAVGKIDAGSCDAENISGNFGGGRANSTTRFE